MLQSTSEMTQKNQSKPEKDLDLEMKVELVVNDRAEAIVFYDVPFKKTLSWLEFDLGKNKLDFIMNDGDVRNFGIPVAPDLAKYMQNAFQVLLDLMDNETGQPQDGVYFPLIIHRT